MMAASVHRLWPTIVGALLLTGAATMLWWLGLREESAVVVSGSTSDVRPAEGPVADYLRFASAVDTVPANTGMIVDGLRKLAGALGTLGAPPGVAVDLRVAAEHVLLNPDAPGTTAAVRDSLVAAADGLTDGGTDAPVLGSLADSIDPRTPVGKQRDVLGRFFVRAAEILRLKANPPPPGS
jgi:hypothetical protein